MIEKQGQKQTEKHRGKEWAVGQSFNLGYLDDQNILKNCDHT